MVYYLLTVPPISSSGSLPKVLRELVLLTFWCDSKVSEEWPNIINLQFVEICVPLATHGFHNTAFIESSPSVDLNILVESVI